MSNIKELHAIIIQYFQEYDLKKIVRFEFNKALDTIAGGDNLDEIAFNLIEWADSTGKLQQLAESLYQTRLENEDFKKIINQLFPNIFNCAGIKANTSPISTDKLNDVFLVFTEINLDTLKTVCKETLENSSQPQDVLGSFPQLINPKSLGIFKTIFLENNYTSYKDVPSILEFAERLSQETKVSKHIRDKLNYWVKTVAQSLNIKLPTYEKNKLFTFTALNSYLLVTVTPNSANTFYLQAELIPNYSPNETNIERIKLEVNNDSPNIECSSSDIVDKIYQFIRIAKTEYLNKNRHYKLKVEIFLPLQFIDANIDLKDVPIDFNRKRPFGSEYRLLIRSLERFLNNDGEYANRLYLKWEQFNHWIQNRIEQTDIQNKIHHISKVDNCNWEEIETELELEEKFGVKITCCLPENDLDKEELFIAVLRGGVPIFLWTRCDLPDINDDFDNLLKIDFFQSELTRIESVWKLRKKAHAKPDKENYLGYHLGFLCDNPHRVPFNLMLQNQSLIETGM
ncbi:hypothetical protein Riv7116_6105 [Rivularia sp. PCC 7116]|uniref:VMAP-C domain-containing protein n=1 Tax=Rivularia sp. PCC 7116 TaxID=373994 RepID=UPI00029EC5A0|nr:effector-associated domain EAD1-containing protein [Rivularia sp. PCC 7116]AFY58461.1 hypothetical protein Riv7116_6105 [Rivularia sp. PCC 7116]